MALPGKVNHMVGEILNHLKPDSVFKSIIECYHNKILIKGDEFFVEKNLHIFGLGKAAAFEVKALKNIVESSPLKEKLKSTVVYTKFNHGLTNEFDLQLEGDHPFISQHNLYESKKFLSALKNIQPEDTLIFCLSGGGSALLELPVEGIDFKKLHECFKNLLTSNLSINEINAKRKSLSQVKNGGLINFISTTNIIQLLTCDIPNEKLSDISSGPLIYDGVDNKVDTSSVRSYLTQSATLLIEKLIQGKENFVFDKIYDGPLDNFIKEFSSTLPKKGETFVSGGELTLTLPDNPGMGGRGTHFVLALADEIYKNTENRDIHILSFASDGTDGPTDGAGAYVNYELMQTLDHQDYLQRFNSYDYFEKIGSLLKTGPTKNNLMDIRFIWRE